MKFSEFAHSKGYKNFMAKVYGIGASVVLLGAMFKIMHWPGASVMIVAGLSTEAFIFFTSAFEPLHQEWDWSIVYPELAGMSDEIEDEEIKSTSTKKSALEKFDELLNSAQITPDLFEKLGNGLRTLNQTTEKLSEVSEATVATNNYVASFEKASTKVNEFADMYGQSITQLNQSASKLATTYENNVNTIEKTLSQFVQTVGNSGSSLAQAYQNLATVVNSEADEAKTNAKSYTEQLQIMAKNLTALNAIYELQLQESNEYLEKSKKIFGDMHETIGNSCNSLAQAYQNLTAVVNNEANEAKTHANSYTEQLQIMAKNLTALNAIYELQLQSSNEYLEKSKNLFGDMNSIMESMNSSVDDVKKYREEISKLSNNVAALNTIYGNMLAAMSFNK